MQPRRRNEQDLAVNSFCPLAEASNPMIGFLETHSEELFYYVLGLAASSLLMISWRERHRAIAGILFILWLALAGAYAPAPGEPFGISWLPSALLALQALLFFVLGVVASQLRFDSFAGPWPVLGGLLMVYSLVGHIFLRAFLQVPDTSFPSIPFPPLILTWGLLLFCRPGAALPWTDRGTRAVLWMVGLIPLVWTGFRVPDSQDLRIVGAAHSAGLRLVFIMAFFFLALPEGLWRERRWWPDRRRLYETCRDRRKEYGIGLFLLLVVILALGFFIVSQEGLNIRWQRLLVSLALLEAALLAFWLLFPAWLNLWFCSVAWTGASVCGWLLSWLKSNAKWIVLLAFAVILVDFAAHRAVPEAPPWLGRVIGEAWQIGLMAAAFLLWLIYLAYQARRRLVIQAFADHTSDTSLKVSVEGIDGLLRNELARISDVYRIIDEARPRAYGFIRIDADVQDVGVMLKEAAGPSASFPLFGIQIPVNFPFALFGRLVRGPRITGSVEGQGNDLALTAELSGGGLTGNWRVHPGDIQEERGVMSGEELLRVLAKQLAYRIATHVADIGSRQWRAVRSYTKGLRVYRETQSTEEDRDSKLRKAERLLFEAAQHDKHFASCHYNLGIVYNRLRELGSAEAAFRVALKKAPENYEACYALAEIHVELKEYEEALQYCEVATQVDPRDARAWDLKSYAMREVEQKRKGYKWTLKASDTEIWEELLKPRRIAAALAWRRLCRARLYAPLPVLRRRKDTAVLCVRNLAVVLGRAGYTGPSARAFRLALRLSPHDQDLFFCLGKVLYWKPDWVQAAEVLDNTLGEPLTMQSRGHRLAMLARVQTQPESRSRATKPRQGERRRQGAPPEERQNEERRKAERRGGSLRELLDHAAAASRSDDLEDLGHVLSDCLERPEGLRESFPSQKEWGRRFQPLREAGISEGTVGELEKAYQALAVRGLGEDVTGAGRLELLQKVLKMLAWLPRPRSRASDSRVNGLEDLRRDLKDHLEGSGEPPRQYLERLVRRLRETGSPEKCRDAVRILFEEDFATVLSRFLEKIAAAASSPRSSSGEAVERCIEGLLRECRDHIVLILQWACGQVEVAVGRLLLDSVGAAHPDRRRSAHLARKRLQSAIQLLERHGFQQPREQGLQSLLAQACLEAAEACVEPRKRACLLKTALEHGQSAVGRNPHGAEERLVLVRIYTVLGDYQQAREESRICRAACLAHDPDQEPETLRSIGSAFWVWMRAAETHRTRLEVVDEAVEFFTRLLGLIECRAFCKERAAEQTRSHAWAHYWLGRFYCEKGDYDNGISHQKIGCALGFKPLEARVNLAWAYLMARAYADAGQAFLEAREEAERQQSDSRFSGIADERDGGDRTVDDLLTDLYLGWGFLALESDGDLDAARWRLLWAEHLISPMVEPMRRRALDAAIQEGLAWIHLQQGRFEESLESANASLRQMHRCGAYCCLARLRLEHAGADPLQAAQQARAYARQARVLDVRRRYRKEIREIFRRVRESRTAAAERQKGDAPAARESAV